MEAVHPEREAPPRSRKRKLETDTEQRVWLDSLPLGVCVNIHARLPPSTLTKSYATSDHPRHSHCRPHLSALRLAAVSPFQKQAAAIAQRYIIHAEHVFDYELAIHLISAWHRVLGNQVREIYLSPFIHYAYDHVLHNALSLSSLVKVRVPNNPVLLHALIAGRSVKSLHLELLDDTLGVLQPRATLAKVIEACPVEHIHLTCYTCIRDLHTPSCHAASFLQDLLKQPKCDSVRSLHLECHGNNLVKLADAAFVFPNLQKLTLQHSLPELSRIFDDEVEEEHNWRTVTPSLARKLRTLKSVSLIHCGTVRKFAPMLGDVLTTIVSKTPLSSEDVRELANCSNLEVIEVVFQKGAEKHFPTNLRELKSITLSWHRDEDADQSDEYTPAARLLTGLVARNQLEEFRIDNGEISYELLDQLLRDLGSRLLSLRLPLKKGSPDFATRALKLVMKYNRSLRDLRFGTYNSESYKRLTTDMHESRGFCEPDLCAACKKHDQDNRGCKGGSDCNYVCEKSDNMHPAWNVAKRRLPELSIASSNHIRWTFGMVEALKNFAKDELPGFVE